MQLSGRLFLLRLILIAAIGGVLISTPAFGASYSAQIIARLLTPAAQVNRFGFASFKGSGSKYLPCTAIGDSKCDSDYFVDVTPGGIFGSSLAFGYAIGHPGMDAIASSQADTD